MPTLKTGTGTIEVGTGRIVAQAERMGKLSEPRRAHRLEKAKALLAAGTPAKAGAKDAAGKGAKGKGAKKGAKAKAGKSKAAKAEAIRPALRQAAAIVLSQGIAEL